MDKRIHSYAKYARRDFHALYEIATIRRIAKEVKVIWEVVIYE
ncbi:MAG: hypothetical protein WBI82_16280 [Sphaerochaeta sp.]|jgi:hypothetical protein